MKHELNECFKKHDPQEEEEVDDEQEYLLNDSAGDIMFPSMNEKLAERYHTFCMKSCRKLVCGLLTLIKY